MTMTLHRSHQHRQHHPQPLAAHTIGCLPKQHQSLTRRLVI